ncbi:MAG: TVP38/TMEM64 family protein [Rhodospirillaceae bacterium]|nr:TVP38/TMEM64 family protein [Rhodospirillaceae bacterium]
MRRLWPLLALALAAGLCFALGGTEYLTFDSLRENRPWLMQAVGARPILSAAAFVGLYVLVVTLSIPGATVLTVCGGFLFGQLWGLVLTVVGATLGATALFLIARTTLGEALRARTGPWLDRMQRGFAEGALSYLLVLRLVPLFPFFVVNLVPALLGVPLTTFVLATFIGIIPGSFVYASVGAGLGRVFESGLSFRPEEALTPQILTALVGLAILSLLPVAYRKLTRGRGGRHH